MPRYGESAKAARRKAEARIRRLESDLKLTRDSREIKRINETIKDIRQGIEETRTYSAGKKIKGRTAESVRMAVEKLNQMNRGLLTSSSMDMKASLGNRIKQSNAISKIHISNATSGYRYDETVSFKIDDKEYSYEKYSETASRLFFKATQEAWEHRNPNMRYENILAYYNDDEHQYTLDEIYEAFYYKNAQTIQTIEKLQSGERLTDEQKRIANDLKSKDESQDKRYRKDIGDSPLIGLIASSEVELTKQDIEDYLTMKEKMDNVE